MDKITFIHTADLHLGSVYSGFRHLPDYLYDQLQRSGYEAFSRLVNTAIDESIDFVVIAGDIFDLENRNLKAQLFFQREMERLHTYGIPVYLIHGNHDYLDGEFYELSMPENVHVFGRQVEMKTFKKSDAMVHLYGFSYGKRHIHERVVEHYQKQGTADYHIGIMHGNLEGQQAHGNYAPFSLNELLLKQFDYWALGHIHKRMELSAEPPAIYPGSLQGRNKKETGEKGFYKVTLSKEYTDFDFTSVAPVIWRRAVLELKRADQPQINEFIQSIKEIKHSFEQTDEAVLIELVIDAQSLDLSDELLQTDFADVVDSIQEEDADEEPGSWIHSIKILPPQHSGAIKQLSNSFLDELLEKTEQATEEQLEMWGSALLNHRTAGKYLGDWKEEEWQEIKDEAALELMKSLNRT